MFPTSFALFQANSYIAKSIAIILSWFFPSYQSWFQINNVSKLCFQMNYYQKLCDLLDHFNFQFSFSCIKMDVNGYGQNKIETDLKQLNWFELKQTLSFSQDEMIFWIYRLLISILMDPYLETKKRIQIDPNLIDRT